MAKIDESVLQAALVGYEHARQEVERKIAEVKRALRGGGVVANLGSSGPRRTMSAAARKRIAAAQRKRWAAFRAGQTGVSKPKRTLSAAGRRRIIAAAKKRWAEYRAKKKAAA